MSNLSTVVSTENGLQLSGSLVFANVSELLEQGTTALRVLQNLQLDALVIDCKEIIKIDSAGIALLIEWKRWCNNHKKKCQINGLPNQAKSLIETYRLQHVI